MVGARTGWAVVGSDGLLSTGTALAEGGQGSEVPRSEGEARRWRGEPPGAPRRASRVGAVAPFHTDGGAKDPARYQKLMQSRHPSTLTILETHIFKYFIL